MLHLERVNPYFALLNANEHEQNRPDASQEAFGRHICLLGGIVSSPDRKDRRCGYSWRCGGGSIEVYSREKHQQTPADPAELRTDWLASGITVGHMKMKCGIVGL